jgi:hypothetical protein
MDASGVLTGGRGASQGVSAVVDMVQGWAAGLLQRWLPQEPSPAPAGDG